MSDTRERKSRKSRRSNQSARLEMPLDSQSRLGSHAGNNHTRANIQPAVLQSGLQNSSCNLGHDIACFDFGATGQETIGSHFPVRSSRIQSGPGGSGVGHYLQSSFHTIQQMPGYPQDPNVNIGSSVWVQTSQGPMESLSADETQFSAAPAFCSHNGVGSWVTAPPMQSSQSFGETQQHMYQSSQAVAHNGDSHGNFYHFGDSWPVPHPDPSFGAPMDHFVPVGNSTQVFSHSGPVSGSTMFLPDSTATHSSSDSNSDQDSMHEFGDEPTPDTSPSSTFASIHRTYPGALSAAPMLSSMDEPVIIDYEDETNVDDRWINNRKHPIYKVEPDSNGLYHCPFAYKEECNHEPAQRHCNVAKNIDSHLRQYRCTVGGSKCKELKMSSQACRLRHEREEHGSHNHGVRPHLCPHSDCERAVKGFKRPFNLKDHRQRMHGESEASHEQAKMKSAQKAKGITKGRSRRRAAAAPTTTKRGSAVVKQSQTVFPAPEPSHRDAAEAATRAPEEAARPAKSETESMLEQWVEQYQLMHSLVHQLNSPHQTALLDQFETTTQKWIGLARELRPRLPVGSAG